MLGLEETFSQFLQSIDYENPVKYFSANSEEQNFEFTLTHLISVWSKVHCLMEIQPSKTKDNNNASTSDDNKKEEHNTVDKGNVYLYQQDTHLYDELYDEILNILSNTFNGNNFLGKFNNKLNTSTCPYLLCFSCFFECYCEICPIVFLQKLFIKF